MATSLQISNFKLGHWFFVATITGTVAADTTFGIPTSQAYVDKDGAVIPGNFFMNVFDPAGNLVERIYVPDNGVSADGLTIGIQTTGEVTRGLKPTGHDTADGSSTYAFKLRSGMIVAAAVDPIILTEFQEWAIGNIGSGGLQLLLGNSTNSNFTFLHRVSGSDVGFLRKNFSTGKVQGSNDGAVWFDLDNPGVGVINWANGLNGGSANANPFVEMDNDVAFLTGGSNAEATPATWAAVTDGSFRIGIDGTNYNVDGIDFTGDVTNANVASTIQAALRAVTGGLETVVWDTDHFIITSIDFTITSDVTVTLTSTGTVGTDISGAGASDWMDCDTGNGTVTSFLENAGIEISNGKLRIKINPTDGDIVRDENGLAVNARIGRNNTLIQQVRACITTNITIATDLNNGDTLDSITLATGDRVLLTGQTAPAENGIYIVGVTPVRDTLYDADLDIRQSFIVVQEGTANAGKEFKNTNTSAITVDTTSITYSDLSSLYSGGNTTLHDHDALKLKEFTASDTLQASADTQQGTTSDPTYVKLKEIRSFVGGVVRVKFDLEHATGGGTAQAYVQIEDSTTGAVVGTTRSNATTSPTTFSEDFTVSPGDKIQLWARETGSGANALVSNFRVYGTEADASNLSVDQD